MKKFKSLILIAFAGLALSACNGASLPVSSHYTEEELADLSSTIETPWVDYSAPATSVSFPEEELNKLLDKGDTYTYNPKISPKSTDMGSLIWTSQNSGVASIDKGKVTAVGGGVTTIEVSSRAEEMEKVELNVEVRVKLEDFAVVKENELDPSSEIVPVTDLDLDFNESAKLAVVYKPGDTTQKGVSFRSTNEDIVTVDENGVVIAKKAEGDAKIIVTSDYLNDLGKEVNVHVTDKTVHVSDVEITNKPAAAIEVNKTYQLEVKVSPDDAVSKDLEFSTSVATVADIDENGLITTLNPGTTTIQVTSQENPNKFDLFDLEVFEVFADSVSLGDDLLLNLNGTAQLKPVYKDGEGVEIKPSRPNPVYSSSDASVASVTSAGVVKAMGVGEATITLTDGVLSASINVKVEIPTVTYTITGLPDWTPDFGADVFVWYWGGSVQGAFAKVNLTYDSEEVEGKTVYSNVKASFTSVSDLSGFLLVRCVNGTTTPDWEIKYGDASGRIYNKTDDFVVMSGVTSYEFVEWLDYPELSDYTLHFTSNGTSWADVDLEGKNENTEYFITNFELNAGDVFVVHMNEDWRGYSDIKAVSPALDNLEQVEDSNDIRVMVSGKYDIYCTTYDDGGYIYIDVHDASDDPFVPVQDAVYTAKIGQDTVELEKQQLSEKEVLGGALAKYSGFENVKAGEEFVFKCDGNPITSSIGPNGDDAENEAYNNFMQSGNVYSIQASKDGALVEITVYEDGYSFWISGGNSATHKEILEVGYYLVGSFCDWEASSKFKLKADAEDENHFSISNIDLEEGAKLKVNNGDDQWFSNKETWTGCGFTLDDGGNLVVSKAGTYTVDFYVEGENDNHIVLNLTSEPEPEEEAVYYVLGSFNDWKASDEFKMSVDAKNPNHYVLKEVSLVKDDKFKVNDGENWFTNKSAWEDCGFTLDDEGNVVVSESGVYTVNLFVVDNTGSDNHITLDKVVTPETIDSISIKLGDGEAITLTETDEELYDTEAQKFFKESVEVTAKQTLTILVDGEALSANYGPDADDVDKEIYNNYMGTAKDGFTIQASGTVNVYVHVWESGWISFWISGGNSATHTEEEPEPVVTTAYYVVGSFNDWKVSDSCKLVADAKDENHYSLTGVELAKDATLKVNDGKAEETTWFTNAGTWTGCGFTLDAEGNVVVSVAGTYTIDFYLEGENDNHIVLTKTSSDAPVAAKEYHVLGTFNEWEASNDNKLVHDAENENKYSLTGVELEKDAKLKVNDGENWFTNKSTWDDCGFTLDDEGNVVVSAAGTYTIDFYVIGDNDNHIVLTKTSDAPVVENAYYVVGSFNDWTANNDSKLTVDAKDSNKYSISGVELAKDATLKVNDGKASGTKWFSNASTWDDCGFTLDKDGNVVVSVAGTYTIDFYVESDNDNHIVLTKTSDPAPEPAPTTKKIDVDLGDWANDSAVIFAWVWGEGMDAQWIKIDSGNASFTVPKEAEHMILVRMASGSASASWDTCWNRTGDIDIEAGKVLTFATWDGGEKGYSTFTWENPAN